MRTRKINLTQLVPTPAGNAPPSGPHARYAQIEKMVQRVQSFSFESRDTVTDETEERDTEERDTDERDTEDTPLHVTWIHHSAPRDIEVEKQEGEVWVLDVHDNVGLLVKAYEHLKQLPPGHPSRVDPAAWQKWLEMSDREQPWSADELAFISDPRFDLVVCIRKSDADQLTSLLGDLQKQKRVIHLPFFHSPHGAPETVPQTQTQTQIVAFAGGHPASMNGLYGFASEVGSRLEMLGADPSIRLAVHGGLAEMAKRMGMEQWLRQHRVDLYSSVATEEEEIRIFANARAAVVLSVIPVGAKTQVVSAMSHGVSPVGLQVVAASTPLENEWAEEGACETWDEMTDKLIILSAASPESHNRAKVLAALDAFYKRAVRPAEVNICDAFFTKTEADDTE
jgi:hypothetical protein